MKIKLKSIHLTNFMTYHDNTFTFGDTTKISGKNGSGKSSIVNGYMWLMFDTDMELHSNPKIRREINGQPVNDMDVSVEAVFDIDGKEVTARKVQKRTFSKDKTSYKDINHYFIDGVELTLKAFNEEFKVDMKLLQMCSNINSFLAKKTNEMRGYLFENVEDITDLDVAKTHKELAELVPLLERYTVERLTDKNKASIAKMNKQIPILDGQIKEKERDVTENADVDVAELELERNGLKDKIKDIKIKQVDISKQYEEYQKLSDGILKLKFELNDLQRKANESLFKQKRDLQSQIDEREGLIAIAENGIRNDNERIKKIQSVIENAKRNLEALREDYRRNQSLEFDENSLVCPYCGQEYPAERKERIRADFESQKQDGLMTITVNGNSLKKTVTDREKELKEVEATKTESENDIKVWKEVIAELEKELSLLPQSIDISDTEEYKAIQSQIAEKEAAMQKGNSADEIRQSLNTELSEAEEQLLEVERKIAKADVSADEKRLAELKKQRMDLEQSKADCEKILDLLSELDKKKNESLSESINALFGIVKFKLYEYNKSGGYKSVCVPMVDNRSILTIESNKGNRLLGKLDIINSIQKIENIYSPVFVDDSEAFDSENWKKSIDLMDCQMILLKVTEDSELKISQI